jgi:hypothetical protein
MTEYLYIYTDDEGEKFCEAEVESDEQAEELMNDWGYVSFVKEELSTINYVSGWFYHNDEEDYNEAYEIYFNNEQQLDNYHETYNTHGHFACDRMDVYIMGELKDTVMKDDRISCMNGWGMNPNPGDNL